MKNGLIAEALWRYRESLFRDPDRDQRIFQKSERRRIKQRRKRARARASEQPNA